MLKSPRYETGTLNISPIEHLMADLSRFIFFGTVKFTCIGFQLKTDNDTWYHCYRTRLLLVICKFMRKHPNIQGSIYYGHFICLHYDTYLFLELPIKTNNQPLCKYNCSIILFCLQLKHFFYSINAMFIFLI